MNCLISYIIPLVKLLYPSYNLFIFNLVIFCNNRLYIYLTFFKYEFKLKRLTLRVFTFYTQPIKFTSLQKSNLFPTNFMK